MELSYLEDFCTNLLPLLLCLRHERRELTSTAAIGVLKRIWFPRLHSGEQSPSPSDLHHHRESVDSTGSGGASSGREDSVRKTETETPQVESGALPSAPSMLPHSLSTASSTESSVLERSTPPQLYSRYSPPVHHSVPHRIHIPQPQHPLAGVLPLCSPPIHGGPQPRHALPHHGHHHRGSVSSSSTCSTPPLQHLHDLYQQQQQQQQGHYEGHAVLEGHTVQSSRMKHESRLLHAGSIFAQDEPLNLVGFIPFVVPFCQLDSTSSFSPLALSNKLFVSSLIDCFNSF